MIEAHGYGFKCQQWCPAFHRAQKIAIVQCFNCEGLHKVQKFRFVAVRMWCLPALMDVFFVSLPAVEALWEVGYIREGMFESE